MRRPGGGRRKLSSQDATLLESLRRILEPATRGDPVRPLLWVSKSHDKLAAALQKAGHKISASSVRRLLPLLGYRRQSNRKANEGASHPDRNAQFEHINAAVIATQATGQPVISVDTKKKELIGNYKNNGSDYRPKGAPLRRLHVHDFKDKELGKVVPLWHLRPDVTTCRLGQRRHHARHRRVRGRSRSALGSIGLGARAIAKMRELIITADCGGSNSARARLWKVELQKLADEIAMPIKVCHYPPGTSKWNKH